MRDERLLIVFVKAPRAGAVKTRLAASIGSAAACAAYTHLVEAVLKQVSALPNVQLRFNPDDAEREIAAWARLRWALAPQGHGDLGERLHRAFAEALAAGFSRVAVIGSDCPYLTAADIEEAWAALETHDLVLGPAADGGYWLIALRGVAPVLFDKIPWSTASVFDRTLESANAAGLRVRILRKLQDIDTVEDWRDFVGRKNFASDPAMG